MTMTKKDYEAVAAVLKQNKPHNSEMNFYDLHSRWAITVDEMAYAFNLLYLNFDRERFMKACGL